MKDQGKLPPALYMVSTPIGNLEDLSPRAARVLAKADFVAAEDTRESRKLLESQGIQRELLSLHEHSGAARVTELVERLRNGETGAYVSDAGTPGVCDPGAALVAAAVAAGVVVVPVPGPSAPVALLSVSGFLASEFSFRGFFPREKKDRLAWAEGIAGLSVFFESPHRIKECLHFLGEHFPGCPLVVGRELTKKFETITRGTAKEVAARLNEEEPRGEYVLVLAAPARVAAKADETAIARLLGDLAAIGAGQKILVRVAVSHGLAKNQAYSLALQASGK